MFINVIKVDHWYGMRNYSRGAHDVEFGFTRVRGPTRALRIDRKKTKGFCCRGSGVNVYINPKNAPIQKTKI